MVVKTKTCDEFTRVKTLNEEVAIFVGTELAPYVHAFVLLGNSPDSYRDTKACLAVAPKIIINAAKLLQLSRITNADGRYLPAGRQVLQPQ